MKTLPLLASLLMCLLFCGFKNSNNKSIKPWSENPWFWQYKNKPVLLLGASDHDNLFQWTPDMLIPHLDAMKKVGANYVRSIMGDSNLDYELFPFAQLENGKYDLNRWNPKFWERLEFFLKETRKRDIIVQIEVWDRFDYSRADWPLCPYNPKNNVNYTYQESGFAKEYPQHPGFNDQPFFYTTPAQRNNTVVLPFQERFVREILQHTLKFDHVLYCIDNETGGEEAWATYWAKFILEEAEKQGKEICVTQMWDNWHLDSKEQKRTFDHPEIYAFCDVSQNSHAMGDGLWNSFQWLRGYLSEKPRPLNTVKNYGADTGPHGSTKNALERWWLHVLGGAASARFHRPTAGLGLNELSGNSIRAARELEKISPFWELAPGNALLSDRDENEAYLTCKSGEVYFVFFPAGGEVQLDLAAASGDFMLKWMDVRKDEWLPGETSKEGGKKVQLKAPIGSECIAVLTKK